MKKTEKPLFAIIPYFGKGYSVDFQKEGNISGRSLTGYGQLPEEYRHIPIIDFTDNELVFDYLKLNLYPDEVYHKGNCTLQEYFQAISDLGITIQNLA